MNAVKDKKADSRAVTTGEGTAKAVSLTGSDVEEAANLTFHVTVSPQHGTLSGTASYLTYTPNANFNDLDSSKFAVAETGDGSSPPQTSDEAAIHVTVAEANDAPTATAGGKTTPPASCRATSARMPSAEPSVMTAPDAPRGSVPRDPASVVTSSIAWYSEAPPQCSTCFRSGRPSHPTRRIVDPWESRES